MALCIPFPLWRRTSRVYQDHLTLQRVLTSFVPPIHNQGVSLAPRQGHALWKIFLPTTGSCFVNPVTDCLCESTFRWTFYFLNGILLHTVCYSAIIVAEQGDQLLITLFNRDNRPVFLFLMQLTHPVCECHPAFFCHYNQCLSSVSCKRS